MPLLPIVERADLRVAAADVAVAVSLLSRRFSPCKATAGRTAYLADRDFLSRVARLLAAGIVPQAIIDAAARELATRPATERLAALRSILTDHFEGQGETLDRVLSLVSPAGHVADPRQPQEVEPAPAPRQAIETPGAASELDASPATSIENAPIVATASDSSSLAVPPPAIVATIKPDPLAEPAAITVRAIRHATARIKAHAREVEYCRQQAWATYSASRPWAYREQVEVRLAIHVDILAELLDRIGRRSPPAVQENLTIILDRAREDGRRIVRDLFELQQTTRPVSGVDEVPGPMRAVPITPCAAGHSRGDDS